MSGQQALITRGMNEDSEPLDPSNLPDIDPAGALDGLLLFGSPETRRRFLKQIAGTSAAISRSRSTS